MLFNKVVFLLNFEGSSGFDLYGYEVSNMDGKSDYFLAADELIERNLGCWGWCAGMAPSLEELSFILAAKKTGSSLIRIHNAEITSSCTELNPNFRTVKMQKIPYTFLFIRIYLNWEIKCYSV